MGLGFPYIYYQYTVKITILRSFDEIWYKQG
jgi:hypothetical protein